MYYLLYNLFNFNKTEGDFGDKSSVASFSLFILLLVIF